jgi:hypothetical protein
MYQLITEGTSMSHIRSLHEAAAVIGLKSDSDGICYGIVTTYLQSAITGNMDTTDKRVIDIYSQNPEELKDKIEKAKQKLAKRSY